jgi:steroid 5-alpha reductase family enzyme
MELKQKHFIDFHKAVSIIVILFLIVFYDRWDSVTAWVYWAMHGTYGILWCTKSYYFPDPQWEQSCSIPFAILISFSLSLYWLAAWCIVSSEPELILPPWYIGCVLVIYILGIFLHFTSDMQKHCYLHLQQPRQLITDTLWSRSRNPNYLGELMIYGAFALMSSHWLPFVILGTIIVSAWIPNMLKKDKSLSRYPQFQHYKDHTGILFPYLGRIQEAKTK